MVSPMIVDGRDGLRLFINVSGNVGPGSPNRIDDVQFVQLGYYCMLASPLARPILSQGELQAFAKITPGAAYFGATDDPLSIAIRAHQAARGGAQDGHVSVGTPAGSYDGGKHSYQIFPLNNGMRDVMVKDFPRIDKHPKCPAQLRVAIMLMMLGGVG
jgi:hypothetical protein